MHRPLFTIFVSTFLLRVMLLGVPLGFFLGTSNFAFLFRTYVARVAHFALSALGFNELLGRFTIIPIGGLVALALVPLPTAAGAAIVGFGVAHGYLLSSLLDLNVWQSARFQRKHRGTWHAVSSIRQPLQTVYWILAAFLLLLALTVPRLRLVGIAGCIILAGLLLWGVVQQRGEQQSTGVPVRERGAPVSPAATRVPIPPAEIVLSEPALTGGGAPFEFRGKIRNESTDILLRTVTIRIVRKDCYEGALDPSGCVTLWQDRHWLRISVPPQESRSFAVPTWPRSAVPRGRGTVEDDFEVLSASGEPVQR